MSTAASTWAGSKLVTSFCMLNRSVWSAARLSELVDGPGPQAATTKSAPSPTARERNNGIRVIPPPTKHGFEEGAPRHFRLPRKSTALFPVARGESAPATDVRHLAVAR